MYLIDKTYFQGIINVPNSNEFNGEFDNSLEIAIDRYVPLFLQNTLGTVLFNELDPFIDGVDLDPLAPQKWINLVDGCSYENDEKVWRGLRYESGLYKESILAFFVYYNQYQETFSSGVGQVVDVAKNAMNVNPTQHLTAVYNQFVDMYQGTCINEPATMYNNGVLFIDYLGGSNNSGYVSLLQFLSDNKADYPTYSAQEINYKNQLGL